ncbi:MAG: SUMF1/EgtB/PvdO family nonheme iron enzyme [Planctomycetes bacterium]|nr:SUMF1/EgtB/PvdO family nonheme iron enzyme [Planctomycetota bacterium]
MTREEDLLFGLIALDMDLLSKEQFLDAARLWMEYEGISFERLLADQGLLSQAQRDEVRGLAAARCLERADTPLLPSDPVCVFARPREGRYEFVGEIGRGGLGRVFEAVDRDLKREVALKLLLRDTSGPMAQRFAREAELTARLEHPNIVPVHEFGQLPDPEGRPSLFLSMKRIRGRNLKALIRDLAAREPATTQAYSRVRLLVIFQEICRAIAFAHSRGVLHRDLKPSNIMIGDFGETLLVDWGLAKRIGEPEERIRKSGAPAATSPAGEDLTALTLQGDVIGTPAYMSPEQARGELDGLDVRTDVYSLGAILYEMLTLRPPLAGADVDEVLTLARAGAVPAPSSVPGVARIAPELEAVCLRAMAFRREDRYPSARALLEDVQLFLDGVKEHERRQAEAAGRIEAGRAWFARFRDLRGEIEAQETAVRGWQDRIPPHLPVEAKRPLWDAEARLRALQEERIDAFSKASAEFGQALAVDPSSGEAADGNCDLYVERFLEAEKKRDRDEMRFNRNLVAQHDREGKHGARLEAPGRLSIRAFGYACDCLRPVRNAEWRVDIAESCTVPWLDGRPLPGEPLTDRHRPVPEVRIFPAGERWGHVRNCPRREVEGMEVAIAKYEERDKRLVLGAETVLGRTPLLDAVLPRGSYHCRLGTVRFPVRIDRAGAWSQDVNLYRPGEIPAGFCCVPASSYIFGGRHAGGREEETKHAGDLFVARFPLTFADWLEFLNDLAEAGRGDEARARQPREGDAKFLREVAGRFGIRDVAAGYPVMGVSWTDALAYVAWRSRRDGRVYRLLHEEEFEKAARGVDGRAYPWGDEYDATYSNTTNSHGEGPHVTLPGSFPADESPYGIVDLGGNMPTWCWNALEAPWRAWSAIRGGAWGYARSLAALADRRGDVRTAVSRLLGVRICCSPASV